jgi:hypothetical protein
MFMRMVKVKKKMAPHNEGVHTFFTSALDRGYFTPGEKSLQYQLDRNISINQRWSGYDGREKPSPPTHPACTQLLVTARPPCANSVLHNKRDFLHTKYFQKQLSIGQ